MGSGHRQQESKVGALRKGRGTVDKPAVWLAAGGNAGTADNHTVLL